MSQSRAVARDMVLCRALAMRIIRVPWPSCSVTTGLVGEHEAGARPRESGEHQSGQHREETHAGEDFDGGDEMPVVGLRVHVAIADRRQRLDGEVEKLQRTVVGNVGDRLVAEEIEESKYGVEQR